MSTCECACVWRSEPVFASAVPPLPPPTFSTVSGVAPLKVHIDSPTEGSFLVYTTNQAVNDITCDNLVTQATRSQVKRRNESTLDRHLTLLLDRYLDT
eukprot:171149-Prorocentrum_minimum.AAC.1